MMAKSRSSAQKSEPVSNGDGTLISYGDHVRMERHFAAQPDGSFLWNVYALEPVTDEHPIHGGETSEPSVWVPKGSGDEAHARALCAQLSGIE